MLGVKSTFNPFELRPESLLVRSKGKMESVAEDVAYGQTTFRRQGSSDTNSRSNPRYNAQERVFLLCPAPGAVVS